MTRRHVNTKSSWWLRSPERGELPAIQSRAGERSCRIRFVVTLLLACLISTVAVAKDPPRMIPTAIFPFQERGADVKELGDKVADLLFATLAANPKIYLVERAELDKVLAEQELSVAGLIRADSSHKVGQLTGAKILVTGSVLAVNDRLYVVAKMIGTETARVVGASVKGPLDGDLDGLVEELAGEIETQVTRRAGDLLPKVVSRDDRVAALKKKLGGGKRPSLWIELPERHVGDVVPDPAAKTELTTLALQLGFKVIDSQEGRKSEADILLIGEGLSQFAARHENLVSVKGRVELRAVDRETGRVLASDRQTAIGVDLAEQLASKNALQDASLDVAARVLAKIANKATSKKDGADDKNRRKKPRK